MTSSLKGNAVQDVGESKVVADGGARQWGGKQDSGGRSETMEIEPGNQ